MTNKAANSAIANCISPTLFMSSKLTSANMTNKLDKKIIWWVEYCIENRHRKFSFIHFNAKKKRKEKRKYAQRTIKSTEHMYGGADGVTSYHW